MPVADACFLAKEQACAEKSSSSNNVFDTEYSQINGFLNQFEWTAKGAITLRR